MKQVIGHKRDHMIIHAVVSMLLLSSGSSSSMHDSKLPSMPNFLSNHVNFIALSMIMVTFTITMMQYSVNIEHSNIFFSFYITNNAGPLLLKLMLKTPSFFTDKQYMLNDVNFCIIYRCIYRLLS